MTHLHKKKEHTSIEFASNEMLNKQQVRRMFMRRLRISESVYYQHFRPKLKFRSLSMAKHRGVDRMPHRIVRGLLNKIEDNPKASDPPTEELEKYVTFMGLDRLD